VNRHPWRKSVSTVGGKPEVDSMVIVLLLSCGDVQIGQIYFVTSAAGVVVESVADDDVVFDTDGVTVPENKDGFGLVTSRDRRRSLCDGAGPGLFGLVDLLLEAIEPIIQILGVG